MLLKTYEKILELFHQNHGYMNFEQLKDHGITAIQIQELVDKEVLEKFARGWYWCTECGCEKPVDHKYIEIGKVNRNAVICMDSACYLQGMLKKEPEIVSVATTRTDRKKMEFAFPVNRYYFQNTDQDGEIEVINTEFGSYKVYSTDRTMCDCIRMKNRLSDEVLTEVETAYLKKSHDLARLEEYGKRLRALKCVKEEQENWKETETAAE